MPGIKQITVVHGIGERISEIADSGSRMGFVIAQGSDADDASFRCESALETVRVDIDNES